MTRYTPPIPMEVVLLAAIAENNVIGTADGKLPWACKEDMQWFKTVTSEPNTCVLMGRKTFDSIPASKTTGEKLPGRKKIVLSHSKTQGLGKDLRYCREWDSSLRNDLYSMGISKVFVIGGKETYDTMMDAATGAMLTKLNIQAEGSIKYSWHVHNAFLQRDFAFAPIKLSDIATVYTFKRVPDVGITFQNSEAPW